MDKKDFVFKAVDVEGALTLDAIAEAPRFNKWMYEVACENLQGQIVEVGSGTGNISACLLAAGKKLLVTDIRERYCAYLQARFAEAPSLEGVRLLDIARPDFESANKELLGQFDSVFALNVVEHIKDDEAAVRHCTKLLKPGGRLVILVPAYQWLYNGFDEALEHYKRYTKAEVKALFTANGLQPIRSHYFNAVGIGGWWFSGTILRKRVIPSGQMRLYNTLVPVFRLIDKLLGQRIGLSVIVEGVKG